MASFYVKSARAFRVVIELELFVKKPFSKHHEPNFSHRNLRMLNLAESKGLVCQKLNQEVSSQAFKERLAMCNLVTLVAQPSSTYTYPPNSTSVRNPVHMTIEKTQTLLRRGWRDYTSFIAALFLVLISATHLYAADSDGGQAAAATPDVI